MGDARTRVGRRDGRRGHGQNACGTDIEVVSDLGKHLSLECVPSGVDARIESSDTGRKSKSQVE